MPKTFMAAIAAATLLAAAAPSQAAEVASGAYVAVTAGSSVAGTAKISARSNGVDSGSLSEDVKAGGFASAAFGTRLGKGFDVEGEVLYLKNDIDTKDLDAFVGSPLNASLQATGVMANAHYSLAPIGQTTLRVGAGVGYGQAKYELLGGSDDKSGAMWQVTAGAAYALTDRTSWTLDYRYVGVPDYDAATASGGSSSQIKIESRVHVVAVGLRSAF
jgi:opacity protein-like surface antigen